MISENLAGKRIAITGATGFLGTAIVERLLRSVPDCKIVCIVRRGRNATPMKRVAREIISNDCFDRLRSEWGDQFETIVASRVTAIAGDVSSDALGLDAEGLKILKTCDTVIHSAATVSFESPLDLAIEVNLLGPTRVAEAIRAADSKAHLIAVSTAYVSGSRRGEAREELITDAWYVPDVDWRTEVTAGRRALADAENESRDPARLRRFGAAATREQGSAGAPLVADRSEKLRNDWVKSRLIEQGKTRAQSLGFPDVYAYTKALGEKCLLESRGDVPVTFVRPSIIESALIEPSPGWIRGFRMAEPILLGVGKGILKSFPGLPEGVLDVIPVDLVVATIIAVAAKGPEEQPSVYQIASGTRQPLRYRDLVSLVTDYYRAHPLYDSEGRAISVDATSWDYPTRGEVQRKLDRSLLGLKVADRVLTSLPLRGRVAQISAEVDSRRSQLDRARGYVEIYGAYTNSEALFRIDRTLELFESLNEKDKTAFLFDPIAVDWARYLHEIHLPSVIAQGRVRTTPSKKVPVDKIQRVRAAAINPKRQLAVFDFENTILRFKVTEGYGWLATANQNPAAQIGLLARRLPSAPGLMMVDRKDRGDFLRQLYRWYRGFEVDQLRQDAHQLFNDVLMHRLYPDAIRRLQEHKAAGQRTLLITGHLDLFVEPLKPLFDDIVCARLAEDNGVATGELAESPPVGEARALYIREYALKHGLSLQETVGYGDSTSDLAMLTAVGFPIAVNPEIRLAALANRRGWTIESWKREAVASDNIRDALGVIDVSDKNQTAMQTQRDVTEQSDGTR